MFNMFAPVEEVWFEEVATDCNKNIAMQSLKKTLKQKEVTGELYNKIMSKVAYILDNNKKDRIYEFVNVFCPETGCTYVVDVEQTCKRLRKATSLDRRRNERGENIYEKRRKQTQATLYRFFRNLFHRQYERRLIELIQPQLEELLRKEVSFYMYNNVFVIDVPYSEQCIKLNDDIEIYFNFDELFDTENNCVEVTFSHIKFGKEVVYARSMGKEIEKILHAAEEYKPANAGLYVHRCVEEAIYNNFTPTKEEIAIAERNGKVLREVLRVAKELKQCAV
jgi:hypothetical protein